MSEDPDNGSGKGEYIGDFLKVVEKETKEIQDIVKTVEDAAKTMEKYLEDTKNFYISAEKTSSTETKDNTKKNKDNPQSTTQSAGTTKSLDEQLSTLRNSLYLVYSPGIGKDVVRPESIPLQLPQQQQTAGSTILINPNKEEEPKTQERTTINTAIGQGIERLVGKAERQNEAKSIVEMSNYLQNWFDWIRRQHHINKDLDTVYNYNEDQKEIMTTLLKEHIYALNDTLLPYSKACSKFLMDALLQISKRIAEAQALSLKEIFQTTIAEAITESKYPKTDRIKRKQH